MSRLSDAHIEAERRLRVLASQAVAGIWADLPGYDEANVDQWLSRVVPVTTTAQRSSVALTDAYLARSLDRRPLGLKVTDLIGGGVRAGVSPEEVYRRPFVTLWSKLGEGVAFKDAASAAMARATGTAAMDVQLAMRATANAVQAEDSEIFGFERAADGGACEFCQLVDGAFVKNADAMALHNHCGCGLEPVTSPRSKSASPLPSGVAVHEHGELGPVLAAPGDHFTSESHI